MTVGKKIVSNVFYYFLDLATITVFGYLFWVLMGKMLVPFQYGILLTTLTIFQIVNVSLTLGFTESLPKFISEFMIKRKLNQVKSFIFFSSNITFYLSFVVSISLLVFSESFSVIFYGSGVMIDVFRFLSVLLFSGGLASILKASAVGLQNFKIIFIADFVGCFIKILSSALFVFLGFQALGGVFGWTVWYTLILIIIFFSISKYTTRKLEIDKKKFMKFSFFSMFSSFCTLILTQGNIVLLSFFSTFESVAIFGVAFLFSQIILFVPNVFLGALFPNISEMWVKKKSAVQQIVSLATKMITITVLPILILFIFFSKFLIGFLYSELYIDAYLLFPTMLLGSLIFGISNIFLITLYSAQKPLKRLLIIFFGSLLSVLLSLLLIPFFDVIGAAFAFFFSSIILLILSTTSINKIISFYFSKRTIFLVPSLLIFISILIFVQTMDNMVLKIILAFFDLILYFILLLKLKVINRNDMKILNYLPDKFGLKKFKKIMKKLV